LTTSMLIPDQILATPEAFGKRLTAGGYAEVTVKSLNTGHHVTLVFSCKKRGSDGKLISRATKEGRVGITDSDIVYIDDHERNMVASLNPRTGELRPAQDASKARMWAATKLLAWSKGSYDLDAVAETVVATRCSRCARKLTDPVSVERGLGPECYGLPTGSKMAV
jgi:hypothetical protein